MLIFTLLFYRITEQIGNIGNLPLLETKDELDKWIKNNSSSVIFYLPNTSLGYPNNSETFEELKYANYAISKFNSKISFALSKRDFINYSTLLPSNFVEVRAYKNGLDITDKPFQLTSSSFSVWCEELFLKPENKRIFYHEELRAIFEGHKTTVIGVDGALRPKHFPKSETFYECKSSFFKVFKINITRGVYIYRPGDRQLVGPISGNYKQYLKSKINDAENVYTLEKKRYLAGYFVDGLNDNLTKTEIQILNNLNDKFKNNDVQFTLIEHGPISMNIFKKGNYLNMCFPFFFVIDSSFSNKVFRWGISNYKKMHDVDYISSFLDDILKGEGNKHPAISDEIDDQYPLKIVNKDFDQKVFNSNDKRDKVISFFRREVQDSRKTMVTLEKIQDFLKDYVQVFFFDFSKNDLPESVSPHVKRLPFIAHFTKGNESNPLILYPPFGFDEIVSNITQYSSLHFKLPDYDPNEMKMSILEDIGKKPVYSDEL